MKRSSDFFSIGYETVFINQYRNWRVVHKFLKLTKDKEVNKIEVLFKY